MRVNKNLIVLTITLSLTGCMSQRSKPDLGTTTPPVESTEKQSATAKETASSTNDGKVYEGTINGVITDSMCGMDHSKMGDTGKDPAKCVAACVASGAKYVLVDDKGDSYSLSDQGKTKELAGQHVAVTGHIDPSAKAIHVHSIVSK